MDADILELARQNSLFVFATDTVWGLGAVSNRENAQRINQLKRRPAAKSLSVVVPDLDWVDNNLSPPPNWRDFLRCNQKAVTLLIDKRHADDYAYLAAGLQLGVRYLPSFWVGALAQALSMPIIATSANMSGDPAVADRAVISSVLLNQAHLIDEDVVMTGAPSALFDLHKEVWLTR